MDFEAVFFSRLHFLEKEARVRNASLEFIWSASDDLSTLFASDKHLFIMVYNFIKYIKCALRTVILD